MRMTAIFFLSIIAFVAPLTAGTISDTYVIPAAAHTRGAGGELWQSDVQLFNPNGVPVNIDALFVDASGSSRSLAGTIALAPNASAELRDIVGPSGGQGALVLSGSLPFVVTSRAYATTPRGTFSEAIVPVSEFIDETTSDAFIPGLASNGSSRTNIGVFAAANRDQPMTISITLLDSSGATAGSRSLTVPSGGIGVVQMPAASIAPGMTATAARIHIGSGSGIATAYASVIDNATSDSTFIAASSGSMFSGNAGARLRAHFE